MPATTTLPRPPPDCVPPKLGTDVATDEKMLAWVRIALGVPCESPLLPVSGGLTNACFRLGRDGPLLKLYGASAAGLTDRPRERRLLTHLMEHAAPGTCKRVLAWFEGGQVEEWLAGSTLPFVEMMPGHSDEIATLLAQLHSCPLPAGEDAGGANARFWSELRAWAEALPEAWGADVGAPEGAEVPGRGALLDELTWLSARVRSRPHLAPRLARTPAPCPLAPPAPVGCRWRRRRRRSCTATCTAPTSCARGTAAQRQARRRRRRRRRAAW